MNPQDPIHVVLLPVAAEAAAVRLTVARDGRLLSREALSPTDALRSGPDQCRPRTVVVVPGTDAPARWVQLSAFSDAQARAAARTLVGDELAAGDATHVAVGDVAGPQGPRPVVAVAESAMDAWIARVEALGLRANAMVPDHLVLPQPDDPEGCVVALRDGDWLVRSSTQSFRVEADLAATVVGGNAHRPVSDADAVEALLALGALAVPINLLQGRYAQADERPSGLRAWRRTAVLAAVLAASIPLLWAVEAIGHVLAARKLEAASASQVAQALPKAGADMEPLMAVRDGLARIRAREDFPRAFTTLANGVQQLDGAAVERVSWQAGAPLRAVILHGDASQLDSLGAHVAGQGLALVTAGTQRLDGRLHSEVDLVEAAP